MWSELLDELKMILPYTTLSTITLDYIASFSHLDLKRYLGKVFKHLNDKNLK